MKNIKDKISELVVEYYARYPELMREDILHTQEVVSYTEMICAGEGLNDDERSLMICAAWLHDIGCPVSKERYGNSLPVNQQNVGREVTSNLLKEVAELSDDNKKWIEDVVGTHHQLRFAEELNFMPLFEADMIVNLLSGYHSKDKAPNLYKTMMKTESGKKLFKLLIK